MEHCQNGCINEMRIKALEKRADNSSKEREKLLDKSNTVDITIATIVASFEHIKNTLEDIKESIDDKPSNKEFSELKKIVEDKPTNKEFMAVKEKVDSLEKRPLSNYDKIMSVITTVIITSILTGIISFVVSSLIGK